VDEEITEVAGAVAHVNRVYKNEETGDEVALWLIVGHAKDIVRHTPDICYPSQGYTISKDEVQHEMVTSDGSRATCWTAVFAPQEDMTAGQRRVFWAWAVSPEEGESVKWEAPGNSSSDARLHFGNTTALYKMYFTSLVANRDETAEESSCTAFARECIPQINQALFGGVQTGASSESSADDGQTLPAAGPATGNPAGESAAKTDAA
jgi:hypothetical protein